MATKALAFTLSLNDLFGSKAPPHTSAKVSVFSVRCSSGIILLCVFYFLYYLLVINP